MHTRNTSSSEESRRQIKRDCFLCFRIPLIAELLTEKQCKNSPQNDRPVITLLPDFTACFDYPIHLLPGEINCQPLKSTQPEPLQKQHHKKHLCSGKRWDFLYTEVNFLSSSFCCHQLQHSWLGNEAAPRLQATWCRQQDLLWVLPYTGSGHGQCHQNSSHLSHKWGVLSSDKEWGSRSEYEAKSLKHSSITSSRSCLQTLGSAGLRAGLLCCFLPCFNTAFSHNAAVIWKENFKIILLVPFLILLREHLKS